MTRSALILAAGILGAVGIGARAFEAHGITTLLDISQPRMTDFSSATEMILVHAPAMLALAGIVDYVPRVARYAGMLFTLGVVLFAGPLLHYGLSGVRSVMMLTPVGGAALILGWLLIAAGGALRLLRKPAL
ncbi:MAG TPA: DUF423 domain-containing protein [Alphaproteobacteria bacterium]|nr:DUF423 domain-containing protein [Alphaproteobacteria bacterium]